MNEVELSDKLCVIDIYADWCAPCRALAPVLEELEREYPQVKFCKINVDKSRNLAEIFNVSSIPLVAIVKDNTYLDFSEGLVPKEALSKLIEAHLD
jgi:thioredoxin 1